MRKIIVVVLMLFFGLANAQELNSTITINTDQVAAATNQQVFKTLQKALTDFVNNTKWSTLSYKKNEKIDCSFYFTITSYTGDQFVATLQVQASRPVYGSTYATSILNINDKEVNFAYTEFQNLIFDSNSFDSNLLSIVAFYANVIVGVDADTFALEGGSKSLENAQTIVNVAQQSQDKGWTSKGTQNRFYLINDMLSPTFAPFRKAMYEYHFKALDKMSENQKEGKEGVKTALKTLAEIASVRPNAFLTRVFFDAKADELLSIFTGGPKVDVTEVIENLNRLSPTNTSKWGQISY